MLRVREQIFPDCCVKELELAEILDGMYPSVYTPLLTHSWWQVGCWSAGPHVKCKGHDSCSLARLDPDLVPGAAGPMAPSRPFDVLPRCLGSLTLPLCTAPPSQITKASQYTGITEHRESRL